MMKKVFEYGIRFIGKAELEQINWGLSLNGYAQRPFAGTGVDSREHKGLPPTF